MRSGPSPGELEMGVRDGPTAMPVLTCVISYPMTVADLDAVMALEVAVYSFPWTRGNFVDSLAAGYRARLLRSADESRLVGYCVAMAGAGEMHLLNITVAPDFQRRGHARRLLADLLQDCRRLALDRLWLEVRESNVGARAAYARLGFRPMGLRPGYYPAMHGRREQAVVMSLDVGGSVLTSNDALD